MSSGDAEARIDALEARIEAVQLELEQKLVQVTTKLKIMNLMVSSHRDKKEAKKKDDDPNYGQFSSSLRHKIESAGDEKSKRAGDHRSAARHRRVHLQGRT